MNFLLYWDNLLGVPQVDTYTDSRKAIKRAIELFRAGHKNVSVRPEYPMATLERKINEHSRQNR